MFGVRDAIAEQRRKIENAQKYIESLRTGTPFMPVIAGGGSNRLGDVMRATWYSVFSTPPHAAATVTEKYAIFRAPFDCTVTSVKFAVGVAVSGQDTNTTHLNLDDGGADRSGTTEVGNVDLTNGNDLAANTEQELSGVAGAGTDFNLDEGDYLLLEFEKVATGLAVGAGSGVVEFRAN